jgi:TolA-binding protein
MNMMNILSLLGLILLSTACIKTADQVNREKRFDSMTEQLNDSQGLVSDLLAQMKDLQTQLTRMNGKVEELEYRQKQVNPEKINKMSETMNLIRTQQEAESTQLQQIQNELKEQRTFMEKVTASLSSMKEAPKTSKKKSAKADLNSGLDLIKRDKYPEARKELEGLIDHPDLTPGDHNKVLFGLGKVEYYTNKPDKALVYFSKIFTKYPKSSLAPGSLLFIGKSLSKLGKKDEAKEAFAKVVEDYPGTKEANEAKSEL